MLESCVFILPASYMRVCGGPIKVVKWYVNFAKQTIYVSLHTRSVMLSETTRMHVCTTASRSWRPSIALLLLAALPILTSAQNNAQLFQTELDKFTNDYLGVELFQVGYECIYKTQIRRGSSLSGESSLDTR